MKKNLLKLSSVLLASLSLVACQSKIEPPVFTEKSLFNETPTCAEGVDEISVTSYSPRVLKSGSVDSALSAIGFQSSSVDDSGNINLRFVAAIYSEKLALDPTITVIDDVSVTFKSTIPGVHGEQSTVCDKMYRQINNGGSPMLPTELGTYNAFVAYTIRNIPVATYFSDELTFELGIDCLADGADLVTTSKTVYFKHGSFQNQSHTLTHNEGVEATTTTTGYKEHYTCDACGKYFVLENENYNEVSYEDLVLSLHEHSFGTWTPLNETSHQRSCECGETETQNHNWDDGDVTLEPTCEATGSIQYTCEDCGATKTETVAAKGHSYTLVEEVPATTVSDGVKEHYCCSEEGCDKLFVYNQGVYTEVQNSDLVIGKLASTWNGSVDFVNYCIGGFEERVSASVVNNKLRFTMTGDLHYGEYRPAYFYQINKSDNHRYTISIDGVTFSSGCQNPSIIINVVNNGVRTPISDYYYLDQNYKEMDLTPYVTCNDVNNVEVIIQCRFGLDGQNSNGEYVDITSITLHDYLCAPANKQYATGVYDIDTMFLGCSLEHINASASDGVFTISTAGTGDTWGAVVPTTLWTTSAFENAWLEVTISEITEGASMIFQVKDDGGEYYLDTFPTAAGVYKIKLASNQAASFTGSRTFRFRFGIQNGTNVTAKVSSIRTVQLNDETFDGAVNLENYSFHGDSDRVSASCVNGKLRLSKFGDYHYGEFRPDTNVCVTKEAGKNYFLSLSDFTWSRQFTQQYIVVFLSFDTGERVCLGNYYWSDINFTELDLTNNLKDGNNKFKLILQLVFGNDGETVSDGYLEIGQMSLTARG